ncbi:MAG TPA: FKBP-type peptidyl-prolyl cis-trans isomerase [Candidatus Didemnitutus sp.]|jgi:FKBP-type peptidyl-prolyl cis-trans isomerase
MRFLPSRLPVIFLAVLALGAPSRAHAQRERLPFDDVEVVEKRWPNAHKTATSLRYVILEPGDKNGPTPKPGTFIKALYKGMLLNGKIFDETSDPAHALHMRLGRSMLIAGWEEALQKMHRGEKWTLIVPSELGYGTRGRPPDIPPGATLVFELTLLDFGAE